MKPQAIALPEPTAAPHLHTLIHVNFIAIVLVVSSISGALFSFSARSSFQIEVSERLWPHLASLIGEAFHDRAALARRVAQLNRDLDVDVTVRDLHQTVLAHAGEATPPALNAADLARVNAGEVLRVAHPQLLVRLLVRDPANGQRLGILEASAHQRSRFFGLPQPVLTWTLAWLIVGLATHPLARHITAPIERLTAAARRVGQGDLASTLTPPAPPGPARGRWAFLREPAAELTELAHAFEQMVERIGAVLRSQQQLLANISHEIRSPLARIRVALELLPCRDAAAARLAAVEADLVELDRLVEDVLTNARLEATGMPTRLDDIDARTLLDQLADQAGHDPWLAQQGIGVTAAPHFEFVADRALLKRALWNMLENAARYGAAPIELAAHVDAEAVHFSVTDRGVGIPTDERDRVLQPFYRIPGSVSAAPPGVLPGGTGLGLTLVAQVARVHGGRVTIEDAADESASRRGCRVTLTIPRNLCA